MMCYEKYSNSFELNKRSMSSGRVAHLPEPNYEQPFQCEAGL